MFSKADKARAKRLMDCYKLTIEQWEQVYRYQGGRCFICGREEPRSKTRLSTDHDHDTGLFRGLLCSQCNAWLGKIENSFKRLGLHKIEGFGIVTAITNVAKYLLHLPAAVALKEMHYGYPGRVGTKAHRNKLKRERKMTNTRKPF